MKSHAAKTARIIAAAAIALSTLAMPLVDATPAYAAPASPRYFNRKDVITRALTWTKAGVPYSQTDWLHGYRTDCSGFVSMAWGLDQSYVTWTLPEVATPISKEDLQPGDIMLNTSDHVVIFGGWTDKSHTSYIDYEEAGSTNRAVRRVVPYPFWVDGQSYKPYRYTGGHNLYDPKNPVHEVQIQTYAGGAPIVPDFVQALKRGPAAPAGRPAAAPSASPHSIAVAKARAVAIARARAVAVAKARARAIAIAKRRAIAVAKDRARREALAAAAARTKAAKAAADQAEAERRATVGGQPLVVTLVRHVFSLLFH